MASGVIITILGILELLNYSYVYSVLVANEVEDLAVMMSIGGIMNLVIAIFAIAAGFGLIIDQEWAWGISMLILVYTTVVSIKNIIESNLSLAISPSGGYAAAILIVSIVMIIVSVIGLIYLGLTKSKYA
ncbi:MAG: hypothetical protein ACFFD2_05180 [Promethearchaeota archaeon]